MKDGHLIIEARRDNWEGHEYTSSRLVTRGRAAWQYGRIEVRARLPEGVGTWPAIWMLPRGFEFGKSVYPDEGTGSDAWPFDKPFYLILNIAVGGSWGGAQGVDPDVYPQRLVVDYVRVYEAR